jgi:hypothetical protein
MRLFFSGLNDSFTLLAFRFANTKPIFRILGILFLLGSLGTIAASLQSTNLIRIIMTAQLPEDNPTTETARRMQQFISIYLGWYTSGQMSLFVAVAVALLLGSIIFVPFSGYVIHGMVSHSEMVIIKNGDTYRIGDSVLFQIISSFTLIQVVGLTVAAQLITFDAQHPAFAIVFVWGIWLLMTLVTALFSWVVEYVARKFGSVQRIGFLGLFILSLALLILLDPRHGTTLFGAAPAIFDFLNQLASGDVKLFVASLVILAGASVAVIYALSLMASHTLQIPEPLTVSKTNEKQIRGGTVPLRPGFLLLRLLFRYNTVTKPVFTAVAFATVIILLLRGDSALTTTMIVLPLAVGVSFGANIFGLISGSVNFLFSIQNWRRKMLLSGTAIIFFSILFIYVTVYGIGLITQSVSLAQVVKVIPAILSVTFATTSISIWLSVSRPLPFSGKSRENLISSPTALIGYVFILLMGAGGAGNIALFATGASAWIIAGTVMFVTTMCFILLYRSWMYTEKYSKRILKETINAG